VNHLNLKADSADGHPIFKNPYGTSVLSPFTALRNIEPEGRRLRLTSPQEGAFSFMEIKTFDFNNEGKVRADRGV
jgi:hypothetical protein